MSASALTPTAMLEFHNVTRPTRPRPSCLQEALPHPLTARSVVIAWVEGMKALGIREEPALRYCKPNHICKGMYLFRYGASGPEVWIQCNLGARTATAVVMHELAHHFQVERDGIVWSGKEAEAEAKAIAERLTTDLIRRGLIPGWVS